jgi:hypothetical protein
MPTREEKEAFFKAIVAVSQKHDFNYIESIVHYCEEIDMEMESAVLLIDDRMKALIAQDAEDLHLIPRYGRLPL